MIHGLVLPRGARLECTGTADYTGAIYPSAEHPRSAGYSCQQAAGKPRS